MLPLQFSIGSSAKGSRLWVLEISSSAGDRTDGKPNFRYIANMHGDEPGGRMLLPQLAEWLCSHYKTNQTAKRIVDGMHLFIMPTMNPDGYAAKQRENGNGYDLNRNFPDPQQLCKPTVEAACIQQSPTVMLVSERVYVREWGSVSG